jgi:hypothetical protein
MGDAPMTTTPGKDESAATASKTPTKPKATPAKKPVPSTEAPTSVTQAEDSADGGDDAGHSASQDAPEGEGGQLVNGKGKERAVTPSLEPAVNEDASFTPLTTEPSAKGKGKAVAKKAPATNPTTPGAGDDPAVAKTPASTGKKRVRKSNANKDDAAARGEEVRSNDEAEKPAKKRKTPAKKAVKTPATIENEDGAAPGGEDGSPAAAVTATPTKPAPKPRKPKDPNAPPSARSKAGKALKEAALKKEAEEKAAADAKKAANAKDALDAADVLTGKKTMDEDENEV